MKISELLHIVAFRVFETTYLGFIFRQMNGKKAVFMASDLTYVEVNRQGKISKSRESSSFLIDHTMSVHVYC